MLKSPAINKDTLENKTSIIILACKKITHIFIYMIIHIYVQDHVEKVVTKNLGVNEDEIKRKKQGLEAWPLNLPAKIHRA